MTSDGDHGRLDRFIDWLFDHVWQVYAVLVPLLVLVIVWRLSIASTR